MRSLWLLGATMLAGCVFQDLAEVPLSPATNNTTNNTSTNNTSTNNTSTNNTSTNNTSTNNTTNNTSTNNTSTNNNTTPVCEVLPAACDGYFACGSGVDEEAVCSYSCGCEGADQLCFGQTQICTAGTQTQLLAMMPTALTVTSTSVIVTNGQRFTVLNPTLMGGVSEALPTPVTTLAASRSKYFAAGGGGLVHFYGIAGTLEETVIVENTTFGDALDMAEYEVGTSGVAIVGASSEKQAMIVARGAEGQWFIAEELSELLIGEPESFGEDVAISPGGGTALVRSNMGIEIFRIDPSNTLVWTYQDRIPLAPAATDVSFEMSETWVAVRVGGQVQFYPRNATDNTVDVSATTTVNVPGGEYLTKSVIMRDGQPETVFFVVALGGFVNDRLYLLEQINGNWTDSHVVSSAEVEIRMDLVATGTAGQTDPTVVVVENRSVRLVRLSGAR